MFLALNIVKSIKILADRIPENQSELESAGLTAKNSITTNTPSITECVAAIEFVFDQEIPIGDHSFVVGEVKGGWIREELLDTDGKIDIFKAKIFKDFKYPKPIYVVSGEVIEG